MSGPVDLEDVAPAGNTPSAPAHPAIVRTDSRRTKVGAMAVRRALPNRGRRTVGAWCFLDHAGPLTVDGEHRPDVAPHPHMGLHTVTWVLEGELLHRDSLGSEQAIRPGQLNLMTAGHGVAHAEEALSGPGDRVHLVQLWVAQPATTRDGPPAFEHHAELPKVNFDHTEVTVLAGRLGSAVAATRADTELVGADLELRAGTSVLPLDRRFEHAVVVTAGQAELDGEPVAPGQLIYLGPGRDELAVRTAAPTPTPARLLLVGGVPFPEPILMWWNLVARTRDEIDVAYRDWATDSGRFGRVSSSLTRVETAPPLWHLRGGP